jgi:hypothetical protein
VDGNPDKQGKRLFNLPVLAPESLAGRTDKILVASTIHQAAIARRIREQMKLSNPLILLRPEGAS